MLKTTLAAIVALSAATSLTACDDFQEKAPAGPAIAPVSAPASAPTSEPGAELAGNDPARAEVQAVLDAEVRRLLDEPSKMNVEVMRRDGDWAFVSGPAVMPDGTEIDLANTALSRPARDGMMEGTNVVALLKRTNGVWTVAVSAIGSTDVPQVEWPQRYRVSPALVGQEEAEGGE
jgi:hypothetical protein